MRAGSSVLDGNNRAVAGRTEQAFDHRQQWVLEIDLRRSLPLLCRGGSRSFFSTPTRFPSRATNHTKGNFAMNAYESLSHTKWERKCYVIQAFARRYELEISNSRYALIRAIEKRPRSLRRCTRFRQMCYRRSGLSRAGAGSGGAGSPAVAGRSRIVLRVCDVEVRANYRRRAPQVWPAGRNYCKGYAYS